MAQIKLHCFECSTELEFIDQVGRREECPKCLADVRVCKNCEFYDSTAYNECRETSADVIREKDKANVCDFFRPNQGGPSGAKSKNADLLSLAEALFKKKN